jgi:hypothetical protein
VVLNDLLTSIVKPIQPIMKTWLIFPRSPHFLILNTLFFLGLGASAAALPPRPLDVNGDTVPDLWALRYQAGALNPVADSDGDGASNASESSAGTDPLAAGSVIRVSSITRDAAGVRLTFPTVPGKRYQVQDNASLEAVSWGDIGALHTGTGGEAEATIAAPGTAKFFRVYVEDVDADNDGVTDYEEILAGFNPNSPTSFGASGLTDKEALLAGLNPAAVNTVSVQAADDAATEPSPADTGLFVITRVGKLTPVTQGSSIREIPREAFLTGLYTVFCAFSLPECQEIPTKSTIPKAFPKAFPKASMSSRPSRTRATAGTLFTISAKSSSSPSPPCSAA